MIYTIEVRDKVLSTTFNRTITWDQADIGQNELDLVTEVVRSGYIGGSGPYVHKFEEEFARKLGVRHAIATNNGTSALMCALYAFKERLGNVGRVAVASFTFIASVNTAAEIFKNIELVDCNPKTWNIEIDLIRKKCDLLIPVDVGGLPADYNSLKRARVPILADSAESVGARYNGDLIGGQADVHIFSFHRAKIMTTGEGGMLTTNDTALARLMRSIGNHGYDENRQKWEYKHKMRGFNYRMTDLQAAIGLAQLRKLDRYVLERREKAAIYKDVIGDLVGYQESPANCMHSYFFFGILVKKKREEFCSRMIRAGIEVKTWTPAHMQRPYREPNRRLSVSESIARRIVLLPIHNRMTDEDVKLVSGEAKRILRGLE
jgi:perosamine synthetase